MKALKYFCAMCAVTFCLIVPAAAIDYTYCADALFDLGFFSGTSTGYELDRAPTRTEAAVMLVRLLGKKDEAIKSASFHPFTDVPNWASPYIGWLYKNQLTKGDSPTTFGGEQLCNLKMYSTFILRSLNYSDGTKGDFTYDKAIDFAKTIGIYDESIAAVPFMRNELVAMSYSALATKLRDSDEWLIEKLDKEGALQNPAAKKHLDDMLIYKKLLASADKLDKTIELGITVQAPSMGQDDKVEISTTKINYACAQTGSHFAQSYWRTINGEPRDSYFYLDDYMYYLNKREMWKSKPINVNVKSDVFPYYYIKSIESGSNMRPGEDANYTVSFYDHLASRWGFAESLSGTLSSMSHHYVINSRGELVRRTAGVLMTSNSSRNYLTSVIEVRATGSNVLLTLPNLSGYVDLTEHMGN